MNYLPPSIYIKVVLWRNASFRTITHTVGESVSIQSKKQAIKEEYIYIKECVPGT